MAMTLKEIETAAKDLSVEERELLIHRLTDSIYGKVDREAERLWIEEAKRRVREFKEGRIASFDGDEVLLEVSEIANEKI